jgi:hypothetical protein
MILRRLCVKLAGVIDVAKFKEGDSIKLPTMCTFLAQGWIRCGGVMGKKNRASVLSTDWLGTLVKIDSVQSSTYLVTRGDYSWFVQHKDLEQLTCRNDIAQYVECT